MRRLLRRNLILLIPALTACATRTAVVQQPAEPPPEPTLIRLSTEDVDAIAALLEMEDQRTLDHDLATRSLGSSTAEVRARAALAIGRVGNRSGSPLLLSALRDTVRSVRARAAFAFGKMADSSAAVISALSDAALRDAPAVAVEATAALGRIGAPAARATIDSLLVLRSVRPEVRQEALLAAWRLPRDSGTIRRVARWTTDPDAETRWRATYALARSMGPAGLPALLTAAKDADARVRANAVRGLRAPLADSAGVREAALAALLAAGNDADPHVRINALRLLPAYREPARTTSLLIERLRDPVVNVGVASAQSLAEVADPAAAASLYAVVIDGSRSTGLRNAALAAWSSIDAGAARRTVTAWADSSDWLLRLHAVRTLRRGDWNTVSTALQRLSRDEHPLVAAEALAAARESADSLTDLRALHVELLAAPHPLVRAAAARGLARRNAVADFDVLLQAYGRARTDSIRDAALAIVEALGRVRASGVPVERSFFLRFPQPPADPGVYRAVRDRIGEPPASWSAPGSAPRPTRSFYVDLVRRLVAPALAGATPPRVAIETAHGEIELTLAPAHAPLAVHNFLSLIERGFYTNTRWHRVVPNFVIQDGDPRGDGSGGPGYTIRDEINPLRYQRGTLGMARSSNPDTGGSQFFITHSPQPHLDGGYTVFGSVSAGMEIVDRIVQEDPILAFRIRP